MKKLSIAYFGSPDFSADFLEKLLTDSSTKHLIEVKLVVTQPDQKVGRKQILMPTPVKKIAIENNINVAVGVASEVTLREPALPAGRPDGGIPSRGSQERRDHERQNLLRSIDLALVYAFAHKIPTNMLNLTKYGFWNIHPSLLPKYRGPSPIAYPLINGDKQTGVTIIKMDDQIDHGPIIAQEELEILPNDRRPDLEKKLTALGFKLFAQSIKRLNQIKPLEQNHSQATYTKLLKKSDGFIPFKNFKLKIKNSPKQLFNLFRGLYPWPGLWTTVKINGVEKRLKISKLSMKQSNHLSIDAVQLEGKKAVDFETFNRAYKIF